VINSPIKQEDLRFAFGKNWRRFLLTLNQERISRSRDSLEKLLNMTRLTGLSAIDVGSGSGLSSLAMVLLGAARVHSFDYDEQSVACTQELKERFGPDTSLWTVESGSVLDRRYLSGLGTYDLVYSWGVLHHTGQMYQALENVIPLVKKDGRLVIAIYNDQGIQSRAWLMIKRGYNKNMVVRAVVVTAFASSYVVGGFLADLVRGRSPLQRYRAHERGMSQVRDWFDWLGGYPFEVASRQAIISFYQTRGFKLENLVSCGSKWGCNEFVFSR
jgi:2-polyprenyl-3-methyl-5-hydroxy-6-metoxy-1,4-benzoquinol methylase